MSGGLLGDLNAHKLGDEISLSDNAHSAVHWQISGTLVEVSHTPDSGGQTTVALKLFGGRPIVRLTLSSTDSYLDGPLQR